MRTCFVLLVLCCVSFQSAQAQRRRAPSRDNGFDWTSGPVEFGVRGGHSFDERVASAGAQLRVPLLRQLLIVPSGDVFLGDEAESEWQLNGDLALSPDELGGLYAGIGVAFASQDPDGDEDEEVETGYNLFAGLAGSSLFDARLKPFVEARWTYLEDFSPFRLALGINVPVR